MRVPDVDELRRVVEQYDHDGYAYVRSMFSTDDIAPLAAALSDGAAPGAFSVTDSRGGRQELSAWIHLGDDFIGVVPRLQPLVDLAAAVTGEPVYHWHSKLSWKRPNTTSLWDWHQDYAFWADDGVARPDMCTIAVAIGPVDEANGCMRLVRGSHRLGMIDVVAIGRSQGSDPDVVESVLDAHPVELCELESGDVVVFHSNTLHSSGPNESELPRTMLMMSYNAVTNPPTAPRHPGYSPEPLDVLPPSAVVDGWTGIFGETTLLDPVADGLDQGYSTSSP